MKNKSYRDNLKYYRSECWKKKAPKRDALLDNVSRKFYGYSYPLYIYCIEMERHRKSGESMKDFDYYIYPYAVWLKRKMRERCNRNLT